jgi:hypothetical protein
VVSFVVCRGIADSRMMLPVSHNSHCAAHGLVFDLPFADIAFISKSCIVLLFVLFVSHLFLLCSPATGIVFLLNSDTGCVSMSCLSQADC